MLKIVSVIENISVYLSKQSNRFPSAIRALVRSPSNLALRPTELCLCCLIPAGVGNLTSVAKCGEGFQSDIDSDGIIQRRQRLRSDHATKTGIPITVFTLDRERLDFAFQFTVPFNLDVADFGQLQLICEAESCLWIRERIVPMLSLESREAWGLMSFHAEKEGLERFVYPTKNVLQDLRMDARYIGSDCFDFAELIGLGIVIEFCSLCLVSVPPLL